MAKPIRRFQYQQRDPQVVKQRSNQRGGDFDSIYKEGIKLYKPREGKNTIRILPPSWPNADHYAYDLFINYGIGIDEQAYLSLKAMLNAPDPLDEARKEAEKDGNKRLADSLKPTKRPGFYLVDRLAEDEGVQFWAAPWTVDKAFCGIAIDEDTGAATMVDHPDEGCDIRFYKEGTGMTTKYPAEKMRVLKPSPLSEDENLANEWLGFVQEHPIPDMLNFYDYDHIAAAFEGHTPRDPNEVKPQRGRANPLPDENEKPRSTKAKAQLDDEEDYDTETGEISARSNGKVGQAKNPQTEQVAKSSRRDSPDEDNEAVEAKMSVQSIRERLAGRRQRPSADDED